MIFEPGTKVHSSFVQLVAQLFVIPVVQLKILLADIINSRLNEMGLRDDMSRCILWKFPLHNQGPPHLAAAVTPQIFVVGFFGMNFQSIPYDKPILLIASMGAAELASLGMIWWGYRKGWLKSEKSPD